MSFAAPQSPPRPVLSVSQGSIIAKIRNFQNKPRIWSKFADDGFKFILLICAVSVLAILALICYELITHSRLSIAQFGFKFFFSENWDPVAGDFGAFPFIYGTLVSSLIALIIAVPLGVGVSIFLTEMCPRSLRAPLSFTTELLA
ncbi:MAG TPA: phosphate ABC transporter permease subunit PstC, partial [Terriglobales bacterium]